MSNNKQNRGYQRYRYNESEICCFNKNRQRKTNFEWFVDTRSIILQKRGSIYSNGLNALNEVFKVVRIIINNFTNEKDEVDLDKLVSYMKETNLSLKSVWNELNHNTGLSQALDLKIANCMMIVSLINAELSWMYGSDLAISKNFYEDIYKKKWDSEL